MSSKFVLSDLLPVWVRNISFQREKTGKKLITNYGFILKFTVLIYKQYQKKKLSLTVFHILCMDTETLKCLHIVSTLFCRYAEYFNFILVQNFVALTFAKETVQGLEFCK